MQVQVIERTQEIQVQEQEILRKEKELEATIRRPAEAEKYRLEKMAEANRWAHWAAGVVEGPRITLAAASPQPAPSDGRRSWTRVWHKAAGARVWYCARYKKLEDAMAATPTRARRCCVDPLVTTLWGGKAWT